MTNPHRKEVTFTLNGEEYERRPTFDIIARIEDAHGALPILIGRLITKQVGMSATANILEIILGKNGPKRTEIQEAVLDGDYYLEALSQISAFLGGLFDKAEQAEGNGTAAAT